MPESVGIIRVPPRHTSKTKEMLREKSEVNTTKHKAEVAITELPGQGGTSEQKPPESDTSKNAKDSPYG